MRDKMMQKRVTTKAAVTVLALLLVLGGLSWYKNTHANNNKVITLGNGGLCGNGVCDKNAGENCINCPQDCGCSNGDVCTPWGACVRSKCGDGICAPGENCCLDCGCPTGKICTGSGNCVSENIFEVNALRVAIEWAQATIAKGEPVEKSVKIMSAGYMPYGNSVVHAFIVGPMDRNGEPAMWYSYLVYVTPKGKVIVNGIH